MAKFQYVAMDGNGKEKKGIIEAETDTAATAQIKQMGLFPTSLVAVKSSSSGKPTAKAGMGFGFAAPKVSSKDLMTTTRQLATLLQAGLPLVRAMRTT